MAAARNRLASMIAALDRSGPLDERMVAHALLGRIHDRGGASREASGEYETVRELWKEPARAVERIGGLGEAESVRYVRLGRALGAVGEAWFHAAEQQRKQQVDPIRFPPYTGARTGPRPRKALQDMNQQEFEQEMKRRRAQTESAMRHIQGPVRDWVGRKQRAIEDVEKAYTRVLELQPVPPPQWVVASAARVGQLWGGFAEDFERAPFPPWMKEEPEVLQAYQDALANATQPLRDRARVAFQTCESLARRYLIQNEYQAICARWIAAHP